MLKAVEKISRYQKFGSILTLDRISVLLDKLGNPQDHLSVVHVTGTNGKGSVSRFIYQALKENGYKVGIYTSPFIEVFNERIEFDGEYISDGDLNKYTDIVVEKAEEMVSEGVDSPTEFEIITAIGFLYFKEKKSDYVVLEVGLGGIGDSTNVIKKPLASVITSISIDHTKELGPNIEDIAKEKAGIIKEGVPVISGVKNSVARQILIDKCFQLNEQKQDLFYESINIPFTKDIMNLDFYQFTAGRQTLDTYKISMIGPCQIENALCAITTLNVLKNFHRLQLDDEKVKIGIEKAKQKCRFEVFKECAVDFDDEVIKLPLVVLDGAHNEDGAKRLRETVETHFKDKKVMMLVGFLADKKVDEMLKEFVQITNEFVLTQPDSPRRLKVEKLESMIKEISLQNLSLVDEQNQIESLNLRVENNRKRAIKQAFRVAKEKGYDALIMAGSFYLIGEARTIINGGKDIKAEQKQR